jgi:hypothetical protein
MKRMFTVIMLLLFSLLLTVPMTAQAFTTTGEEQVVPTGEQYSPPASKAEVDTAAGKVSREVKNLNQKLTGKKGAITKLAGSVQALTAAAEKNTSAITDASTKLRRQARYNTYGICGLLVIVGVIVIFYRRSQRQTTSLATAVKQVTKAVEQARDQIISEVGEVPGKTAERMSEATTFEVDTTGFRVKYTPSEGCWYETIHVPKNMDGNPLTYERTPESNRGTAKTNFRRTMEKYFRGDFDSPEYKLQKELLQHLIRTKEISFHKIS